MKFNNADNYEKIDITLTKAEFPIAFENKVQCLMTSGMTRKEAEKMAEEPIEIEIYYKVGAGLFAIEAEAVDSGGQLYDPYSGEEIEDCDE